MVITRSDSAYPLPKKIKITFAQKIEISFLFSPRLIEGFWESYFADGKKDIEMTKKKAIAHKAKGVKVAKVSDMN